MTPSWLRWSATWHGCRPINPDDPNAARQHRIQQLTDAQLIVAALGESIIGGDGTRPEPASSHKRTTETVVVAQRQVLFRDLELVHGAS